MCVVIGTVVLSIKTKSLILFYLFFELRVLPITLIVFFYGYQPEKLRASLFLLLYTVTGSLPLLWMIVSDHVPMGIVCGSLLAFPITLCFMIKTPMYLLHIWLPKAHVQAPIGGSMVLARVLLKLGSYGLLLFLPHLKLNLIVIFYYSISLLGSIVRALICMRQGDLKLIIAYSSIVHMGVVRVGFLCGTELGYTCGLIMAIRHGLCSPILFAYSYWLYESTYSRLSLNNPRSFPNILGGMFALVTLNIGVPPSLGLWSEVFMTISVLNSWGLA